MRRSSASSKRPACDEGGHVLTPWRTVYAATHGQSVAFCRARGSTRAQYIDPQAWLADVLRRKAWRST